MSEKVSDEMLMAFVDGETDAETTAMIERALSGDEALALRARRLRETRTLVREAFGDTRAEPVPQRLVEAALAGSRKGNVVAFPSRRVLGYALPLAASLALVFGAAGYMLGQGGGAGAADPLGRAVLAQTLADTASGESRAIVIGGTQAQFRTLAAYRVDGGFCRSFDLSGDEIGLSGVGCDRGAGWSVDLTVARAGGEGGYAPASAAALSSIDAYLDALEASAPLDPGDEGALQGR